MHSTNLNSWGQLKVKSLSLERGGGYVPATHICPPPPPVRTFLVRVTSERACTYGNVLLVRPGDNSFQEFGRNPTCSSHAFRQRPVIQWCSSGPAMLITVASIEICLIMICSRVSIMAMVFASHGASADGRHESTVGGGRPMPRVMRRPAVGMGQSTDASGDASAGCRNGTVEWCLGWCVGKLSEWDGRPAVGMGRSTDASGDASAGVGIGRSTDRCPRWCVG